MKSKTIFTIIVAVIALFSCKTSSIETTQKDLSLNELKEYTPQVQIAEAYAQQTVSVRDYRKMVERLEEVFQYWIAHYVSTKIYWDGYTISKNMFFNKEKTKVLILVQRIYPERNKGVVQLVSGEMIDGQWQFYDRGKPSFSYGFRGDRRDNQPTLKELEYATIQKLCEDGMVKRGKVSQKYINDKWF